MQSRDTTNNINLGILFIFVISPFIGYLSQTFTGRGFITVTIPILTLETILLLGLRRHLVFTKEFIALLAYGIYTIVSDAVLVEKDLNLSYFITNDIFGSVLILFIIQNTFYKKPYMQMVFKVSVVIIFIAFIVTLIQQFGNLFFFVSPDESRNLRVMPAFQTRLPSIYSWVGPLAVLAHCFFPILAIILAQQLKNKSKYVWLFFLIGGIVAFLSKSRFIVVNYLLMFLLIPIYRKVQIQSVLKFLGLLFLSLTLLVYVAKQFHFNIDTIVQKRLLESDQGGITKGNAGTRLLAFEIFGSQFPKNPVFGKGKFHTFDNNSHDYELVRALAGRSSQIHVGFLSLFYYYGIVGGGIFIIFLIFATTSLFKSAKKHHYWGPFFGFIQFLFTNTTSVWLHIYFMGYILCFMFDLYYQNQEELKPKLA
jgi:hypothetical protein